jgi:hypothetical protein
VRSEFSRRLTPLPAPPRWCPMTDWANKPLLTCLEDLDAVSWRQVGRETSRRDDHGNKIVAWYGNMTDPAVQAIYAVMVHEQKTITQVSWFHLPGYATLIARIRPGVVPAEAYRLAKDWIDGAKERSDFAQRIKDRAKRRWQP